MCMFLKFMYVFLQYEHVKPPMLNVGRDVSQGEVSLCIDLAQLGLRQQTETESEFK